MAGVTANANAITRRVVEHVVPVRKDGRTMVTPDVQNQVRRLMEQVCMLVHKVVRT